MTLLLSWRLPPAPLQLVWRGEDRMNSALAALQLASNSGQQIPTIIGPVGPPGPAFDLDNAVIDGGTFN